MRHLTSYGNEQCRDGSSNLLTPHREQPQSSWIIVVGYPRPACSATKRTNHPPISFDQQAQVFQPMIVYIMQTWGKLLYRGPWRWRPWAGENSVRASIRPFQALYNLWKTTLGILPVELFLLALVGRKQTIVRDQLSSRKLPCSRLGFSRARVQHSPCSSAIELPFALAESSV